MSRHDPEPLIYVAWIREITRHLFLPVLHSHLGSYWRWPEALDRILTDDVPTPWCPTPGCPEVVAEALIRAVTDLKDQYGPNLAHWKWGNAHQAALDHRLLSRIPLLKWMIDSRIATDGGNYTLNRGTSSLMAQTDPFTQTAGPGYRGIYDLANPERSSFMIATGQSGNPLSPHYNNLTPLWRDGQYLTITGTLQELKAQGGSESILTPGEPRTE